MIILCLVLIFYFEFSLDEQKKVGIELIIMCIVMGIDNVKQFIVYFMLVVKYLIEFYVFGFCEKFMVNVDIDNLYLLVSERVSLQYFGSKVSMDLLMKGVQVYFLV